MKKLFISMLALVAVLASCSKSAVVEVPFENIPIKFSPYNGRTPEVKSTSFEDDSLSSFRFHALAFLNEATAYLDKEVYRATVDETEIWDYDGVSYWPGTTPLEFLAYGLNTNYAENDGDDNIVTLDEDQRGLAVSVPTLVKDQRDLLVATPVKTNYTESDGTVRLNFSHMFARIQFSLKTKDGNDLIVGVEDINIKGNFYNAGTIDLTYDANTTTANDGTKTTSVPAIVPSGTAAEVVYNYITLNSESYAGVGNGTGTPIYDNSELYIKYKGEDEEGNETTSENDDEYVEKENGDAEKAAWKEKNRFMMIIPVEGTTHQAKLNVKYFLPFAGTFSADSNPSTEDVDPIDLSGINFEAGKSYNFILEVSTNSISFEVEITDWVDATADDYGSTDEVDKQVIKLN